MRFSEVNLLGVYVAPITIMMFGAWILLILLRRIVDGLGLTRRIWHPTLLWLSVYIMVLTAIVHIAAFSGFDR